MIEVGVLAKIRRMHFRDGMRCGRWRGARNTIRNWHPQCPE